MRLRRHSGLRRVALLAALATSAAALPCPAQGRRPPGETPVQTFTIRGSVRLAHNEAGVERVRVDLRRFTGETVTSRFTGTNGEFEFIGVGRGTYLITVNERGFAPAQEEITILNSSRSGVLVYLRPADPEFAVPQGPTVSIREYTLPKKAREAFARGLNQARERRDLRGSIPHFQRAIQEVPDYFEAHYHLGLVFLDLGQVAEAEQALNRSIEASHGRFADPYFALASLHSNRDQFASAEPLARRGLEIDYSAWQGHFELARALYGLNRIEEASASLAEAKNRREAYAPFHLLGANICLRRKDYPALLGELEAYLKLDSTSPTSESVRRMRDQIQQALRKAAPPNPPL